MKSLEIFVFVVYSLCLTFIFLYSLVQLQLAWLYFRSKKNKAVTPAPALPTNWPLVTVQLPLYNEIYVTERLLDCIMALDYPPEKLQVQVLDDSTDNTTALVAAKVAAYQAAGRNITHVRRPNRTGYKAGALQYGLASATGEFIAVFDADFLPKPDFLQQTIPAFDAPHIGVVQTRWGHLNQDYSILTQLQAFGLNAHFTVEQTGRSVGGHFINFNGTAGIWRKSCILDAGGWQPDTLTEDLDLSYRAQLKNWRLRYLENVEAPAELPAAMNAIKSQQFRWTKGAAETARKHLKEVLFSNLTWGTKVNALFHLLNSSVFVALLIAAILSVPVIFFIRDISVYNPLFSIRGLYLISLVALILFYWLSYQQLNAYRPKSILSFISKLFFFLVFSMGLSLHNSIAVIEGFLGKKTPFIRTPKFNIRSVQDRWQNSRYAVKNISVLAFLEGLLCLYFLFGVYLDFRLQSYGTLPFHVMLSLGFGSVFYYSLKHSQ
ncbi:cellulose synthase family protein [Adhaeribacter rhizoryzae]|uniref:Glycosyltransferase n=1 Tax=Adhaeribacter rhizoryzae TaxID=2607907 RepID=A0A5M6DBB8_9BACT|nr:cellulose synthase family protein [Adhaeribacter rhizoryzae]KAA5544841.1 glycosyltransferase [Adhaeribacter rhizoryzae]